MNDHKAEGAVAGEAIRSAVREQIAAGDPPEAAQTFARLRGLGLEEDQAVEFMAAVFTAEIFDLLKNHKPYDRERYEKGLRALPQLPWERSS